MTLPEPPLPSSEPPFASRRSGRGRLGGLGVVLFGLVLAGSLVWQFWGARVSDEDLIPGPPPVRARPLDTRTMAVRPFDLARLSPATRFDHPLGSSHGAFAYNAQSFLELNSAFGGNHLGDDLNGIGGQNSDLGDSVFAVADGLVIYRGKHSAGWGNVVILAHRLPDGQFIQSFYAHLEKILVASGEVVGRGARVGTVGTAGGRYLAHLHFEIRRAERIFAGAGYLKLPESTRTAGGSVPGDRLAPSAFVESMRGAPSDHLNQSPYQLPLEVNYSLPFMEK